MNAARPQRLAIAVTGVLALAGLALAVQAWLAGSLWRYVLAGLLLGALACVPLLLTLAGPRGRWLLRRLSFAAVPVLLALGALELGMRWFGPPRPQPLQLLADDRLGHVVAPGTGGTDADGFRNPTGSPPIDVVFVGDSQTWGFAVAAAATMAVRCGALTGRAVRQFANGGYGPVQYVALTERALQRGARALVVGFYFGNDLVDACDYAALAGAESLRTDGRDYSLRQHPDLAGPRAPNWTMAGIDAVLQHSAVLEFAAAVVKSRLQGGLLDRQLGAVPFADARVPTVLLPAYRLPTMDRERAEVQEGLVVTARALVAIERACNARSVPLLLLLIPTKEYCYAAWCRDRGEARAELDALLSAETAARRAVLAAAEAAAVTVHDLAPACIASLAAGEPVWPAGGDGHLNAHGHQLAANAVAAWLAR